MSREAPGLAPLVVDVRQTLGAKRYGGVIGDGEHFYGYHLGRDRIFSETGLGWQDYSVSSGRDRGALSDFATAIDIGNDWPLHSKWLLWLVKQCRAGKYADIREIIGTLDGFHVIGWDAENQWRNEPGRGDNTHLWHTHISFYRDAALRDQSYVLRHFFEPAKAKVVVSAAAPTVHQHLPVTAKLENVYHPSPTVYPSDVPAGAGPAVKVGLFAVVQVAVWWIIRRRMEAAREDSE